MQRALTLGVAAVVLLLVAPSPSRAAGVTRTAPFDYGIACVDGRASFAVPPFGHGTPLGCVTVPHAPAYGGVLTAREDGFDGHAGVVYQGQARGGVAAADAGPRWSAAGLNVKLGSGGRLSASALIEGGNTGTVACLTVGWANQPPMASKCDPRSPSVSIDAVPAGYVIQVTLYTPRKTDARVPAVCPPSGLLTCSYGGVWTAGTETVTVKEISYSLS